ncbi:MAG: hypothetical protein DWP97_08510 [Calditrichaeota bacterium]|nr:MAG: hypothetical protein DWP97_08510 [Calditrichota bacterium]
MALLPLYGSPKMSKRTHLYRQTRTSALHNIRGTSTLHEFSTRMSALYKIVGTETHCKQWATHYYQVTLSPPRREVDLNKAFLFDHGCNEFYNKNMRLLRFVNLSVDSTRNGIRDWIPGQARNDIVGACFDKLSMTKKIERILICLK